jgi:hypothetical protein
LSLQAAIKIANPAKKNAEGIIFAILLMFMIFSLSG